MLILKHVAYYSTLVAMHEEFMDQGIKLYMIFHGGEKSSGQKLFLQKRPILIYKIVVLKVVI